MLLTLQFEKYIIKDVKNTMKLREEKSQLLTCIFKHALCEKLFGYELQIN